MANLVIGTTPTHTFTVDTDLRDAVEIWITYAQNRKNIINKTLADGIEVSESSSAGYFMSGTQYRLVYVY